MCAPTQSFSTREHSLAISMRPRSCRRPLDSSALAPSSASARHNATSNAAEEDRPAPLRHAAHDLEVAPSNGQSGALQLGGHSRDERAPALRALNRVKVERIALVEVARVRLDAPRHRLAWARTVTPSAIANGSASPWL